MTVDEVPWTVRLTATAKADFRDIIDWTFERFGDRQALVYAETLALALETLRNGPSIIGVKERFEVARGVFTLHIGRAKRPGRHIVVFQVADQAQTRTLEVLRLLHEAMEIDRYVPHTRDR